MRRFGSVFTVIWMFACQDGTSPKTKQIASVAISAATEELSVGDTVQLTAVAMDENGASVEDVSLVWSTSDAAIATVDGAGVVTGLSPGDATIRATTGEVSDSIRFTVLPPSVANIVIFPDTFSLTAGDSLRLMVTVRDANGVELNGRPLVWSSGDQMVATVDSVGVVTAIDPGVTTITAAAEGKLGTSAVTVLPAPLPELRLTPVALGLFPTPTFLTAIPGDSRLLVVGVDGQIWLVQDGHTLPGYFLDLRARVHQEREMGLYSLVLHPQFAQNHYIYVDYTDASGTIRIERFKVDDTGNRADPASRKLILAIEHPPSQEHFGGSMEFGPDGMLYIGVGDGGAAYSANARDRGTLLGKILRIDVDSGDPYSIPADNPFVGEADARGEIWGLGLRNPWRLSIDRQAGMLYVADVGEVDWEEVNVVPANQGGLDYGWPRLEGSHCYPPGTSCDGAGTVTPVVEYAHSVTPGHAAACAVTGGYVYRGSRMPGLRGHYFYGDLCAGWVRSFRYENGKAVDSRSWSFADDIQLNYLVTFGKDSAGELYVLPYSGTVYRLDPQ
jgi:glucose/arabinose dehydrogenase